LFKFVVLLSAVSVILAAPQRAGTFDNPPKQTRPEPAQGGVAVPLPAPVPARNTRQAPSNLPASAQRPQVDSPNVHRPNGGVAVPLPAPAPARSARNAPSDLPASAQRPQVDSPNVHRPNGGVAVPLPAPAPERKTRDAPSKLPESAQRPQVDSPNVHRPIPAPVNTQAKTKRETEQSVAQGIPSILSHEHNAGSHTRDVPKASVTDEIKTTKDIPKSDIKVTRDVSENDAPRTRDVPKSHVHQV